VTIEPYCCPQLNLTAAHNWTLLLPTIEPYCCPQLNLTAAHNWTLLLPTIEPYCCTQLNFTAAHNWTLLLPTIEPYCCPQLDLTAAHNWTLLLPTIPLYTSVYVLLLDLSLDSPTGTPFAASSNPNAVRHVRRLQRLQQPTLHKYNVCVIYVHIISLIFSITVLYHHQHPVLCVITLLAKIMATFKTVTHFLTLCL
jgi:hypothetical protein